MNDRQLLELAAKAIGFGDPQEGRTCWTESEYPRGSGLHGALWNYVGHMDTAELWNPFTDDGDALRLGAKLNMFDEMAQFQWNLSVLQEKFKDPAEAVRRAIVETAVEIERAKA